MRLALSIVELGGYPNLAGCFRDAGFELTVVHSLRKAIDYLANKRPAVIMAEFNVRPDVGEHGINLESLLATVQHYCPAARVIVLYDPEVSESLQRRLIDRGRIHARLAFPVREDRLRALLQAL